MSGGHLEKIPHLVNWSTVLFKQWDGGSGIRRVTTLNKALQVDLVLANGRESVWRHLIRGKFEEERGG